MVELCWRGDNCADVLKIDSTALTKYQEISTSNEENSSEKTN